MQTLRQIRQLLEAENLTLRKRRGQCFLIDRNLMGALVELAELTGAEKVLEVGSGTGTLTEELLDRVRRVVAVEIDPGLHRCARKRLGGRESLTLLRCDALASKHAISPGVLDALAGAAAGVHLVANLPYSIATPLVADCLVCSHRAVAAGGAPGECRFDRLTFTVQQEVADRLAAEAGGGAYGAVSVLVALLGRVRLGPAMPPTAFWPRPKVASRMVRIDFDADAAGRLASVRVLQDVLNRVFTHRRKQIGSVVRRPSEPYTPAALARGLAQAEIDRTARPEAVPPESFRRLANALAPE